MAELSESTPLMSHVGDEATNEQVRRVSCCFPCYRPS